MHEELTTLRHNDWCRAGEGWRTPDDREADESEAREWAEQVNAAAIARYLRSDPAWRELPWTYPKKESA